MRMLNCFSEKATVVDPLPFIVKARCELRESIFLLLLFFWVLILHAQLSSPACRLHVFGRAMRVRTLATRLITQSLTNHCSLAIT